jgi:hypothetical protein
VLNQFTELDILIRLDSELPVGLSRASIPSRSTGSFRAIRRASPASASAVSHPATGRSPKRTSTSCFESVHASVPADIDPAVIKLLDNRLIRLIEVGANIAGGGQSLT